MRKIRAIDTHVYPSTDGFAREIVGGRRATISDPAGVDINVGSEEEWAGTYRDESVLGIVHAFDAQRFTGSAPVSNDYVADLVAKYSDVFVGGLGSLDATSGKNALAELTRCVQDLGLLGVSFEQHLQGFFPNDLSLYPLWERAQELGAVVVFHAGTHWYGAGLPGGGGVKLKYGRPIPYVDDVAADFPNLQIVSSRPAWPWQDEAVALGLHKANVAFDLAGYLPEDLPEAILHDLSRRLAGKIMMGTDHPLIAPGDWLTSFAKLDLKPAVQEQLLWKNAVRVFGLDDRLPADVEFAVDAAG